MSEPCPLVWAFIPHWIEDSRLVSDGYDTEQTKAEYARVFHDLGLPWVWQPIVPACLDEVIEQVRNHSRIQPALVLNFCDGADANGVPGVSVIDALEEVGIVYTGADPAFYRATTCKVEMKQMLEAAGVPTPPFDVLPSAGPVAGTAERLGVPLFVKPSVSSGSYGISVHSVVWNDQAIAARRDELRGGEYEDFFAGQSILVERFIDGEEFTALVGGYHEDPDEIWCLPPVERVFDKAIPADQRFLSFDEYWGYGDPSARLTGDRPFVHYEKCPPEFVAILTGLVRRAYLAMDGTGYGRVDIRRDRHTGALYVLEVNANCGISASLTSSCGNILRLAGLDLPWLMERILGQTLARAVTKAGPR